MAEPVKRYWRRRIMGYLIGFAILYVLYCTLLFFFQTKLIFPADFAGPAGKSPIGENTQVIQLPTDQGVTVAWLIPARSASAQAPAPLVVFFHGNGELIDHQSGIADMYHAWGLSVLMVEYRGYGDSGGTPSQKHIVDDTLAVLDRVLGRDDIDASRLVLHGRSIGGGVAAQVAERRPPAALIVESTATSVAGMAWRYGVPPFLVTSPLNTKAVFEELDTPVLIMHGERDEIFPIDHARRLHAAAAQSTLVLFDADHNTLPSGAELMKYRDAVRGHLIAAGVLAEQSLDTPGPAAD